MVILLLSLLRPPSLSCVLFLVHQSEAGRLTQSRPIGQRARKQEEKLGKPVVVGWTHFFFATFCFAERDKIRVKIIISTVQ